MEVLIASAKEVGPAIFASLLVIAIAFMPVFTLEAQEGRLCPWRSPRTGHRHERGAGHHPDPGVLPLLVRGRIIAEQRHPVSWLLQRLYAPILRLALRLLGGRAARARVCPHSTAGVPAPGVRVHAAPV